MLRGGGGGGGRAKPQNRKKEKASFLLSQSSRWAEASEQTFKSSMGADKWEWQLFKQRTMQMEKIVAPAEEWVQVCRFRNTLEL